MRSNGKTSPQTSQSELNYGHEDVAKSDNVCLVRS
jgi:hypothetical protein